MDCFAGACRSSAAAHRAGWGCSVTLPVETPQMARPGRNRIDSDWIDSDLDGSLPRGASSRECDRPRCPPTSGSAGLDQDRLRLGRQLASWCILNFFDGPLTSGRLVGPVNSAREGKSARHQGGTVRHVDTGRHEKGALPVDPGRRAARAPPVDSGRFVRKGP
jgi:hypothetical protein